MVTNIFDTGANLSQVKQIGGGNTVFYAARGFNALDQLSGITFGNGIITTNNYFANSHRLQQVVTYKTGGTNIQNLSYAYDQVSNLKGITDGVYSSSASAALSSLVYDDLHRLTSLTRPATGQTTTFSYDGVGQSLRERRRVRDRHIWAMARACRARVVKSANGVNYAYDQNGNMLVRGTQRLAYDPENRLAYVVTATNAVTFGYDANGSRLWKQGTNGNLQVWIDGNYEEKNGQILFHINADGRVVCTFDKTGTNIFSYYHPDHLHSTSIETDTNGIPVKHYEYYAYGSDRYTASSTAFPVSKRFTSQIKDEDTGLYFYGQAKGRYYDPQLARFIQPDNVIPNIFDPESYNRYEYCRNNPLRFTDPSGHSWYDYIPGVGPGVAEYQGNQALNAMAVRLGDQCGTGWQSYNEMRGDLYGNATAGNISEIAGVAKITGGTVDLYTTAAQEIATVGIGTAAAAITRVGRAGAEEAAANTAVRQGEKSVGEEGANLTRQTSKIDRGAFRSEREIFWKTEAKNNPGNYSAENLERMKQGKAPVGLDGHPMELHHVDRTPEGTVQPMTRTEHRLGDNYKKNHPPIANDDQK